jgi:antitoxin component YwqK of YwqJK toxin-antitoxin module
MVQNKMGRLRLVYGVVIACTLLAAFPGGCSNNPENKKAAGQDEKPVMTEDGLLIREEYYDDGALKARWTEFAESPGHFVAHGRRTMWYRNGQKMFEGKARYGEPDSLITYWYPNGHKKQEMLFVEGKQTGAVRSWYENGALFQEAYFMEDLAHGTATIWDSLGQKIEELSYQNGKKHGECRRWSAEGTLISEQFFEEGNLVRQTVGDDDEI